MSTLNFKGSNLNPKDRSTNRQCNVPLINNGEGRVYMSENHGNRVSSLIPSSLYCPWTEDLRIKTNFVVNRDRQDWYIETGPNLEW